MSPRLRGIVAAVASAAAFGSTIVISRELAVRGFGAPTTFGMRFALAAIVIFGLLVVTGRPLAPAPGERVAVVLLGLVGYFGESTLFFGALANGSAAMVTLLFYVYPAVVVLMESVLARQVPAPRTLGALGLALGGSTLIVVSGGGLSITTLGIAFSLGSALAFSLYLVVSHRVVRTSDPVTSAAWLAMACGAAHLARGVVTGTLQNPAGSWSLLVLNALMTVVAFVGMFAALRHMTASDTAVVFTGEALTAILLGWVFLGEPLTAVQIVGGLLVLTAAVVIGTAAEPDVAADLDEAAARPP